MQPSTHSIQTSVPVPVKPTVRQAVGKNNIKPHAKNTHGHVSGPASSAVNTAAQATLVTSAATPNANKALAAAELVENDLMIETRSSSKQKVGTLLREWDWN